MTANTGGIRGALKGKRRQIAAGLTAAALVPAAILGGGSALDELRGSSPVKGKTPNGQKQAPRTPEERKAPVNDPAAPTPRERAEFYQVEEGDTLSDIALVLFGDASKSDELFALNQDQLANPHDLEVGMVLRIRPPAPVPEAPPPAENPQPAPVEVRTLVATDSFDGQVALTFDEGPHPVHTNQVLDILQAQGVQATFFVRGDRVERHPELVRRIVEEGHLLGSRSFSNDRLDTMSKAEVEADLAKTQAAVDAALGRRYPISQVRPPFGGKDAELVEVLQANGQALVMWNVDSRDSKLKDKPEQIARTLFEGANGIAAGAGAILFHDVHPQTVEVLPDVIDRLKAEGYALVTSHDLLREKYSGLGA